MRPKNTNEDEFNRVNPENTVGVLPVRNAAGQKPVALLSGKDLTYAAQLARVEYERVSYSDGLYLWLMDPDYDRCSWIALSDRDDGQYPDEAVVLAGRIDRQEELIP